MAVDAEVDEVLGAERRTLGVLALLAVSAQAQVAWTQPLIPPQFDHAMALDSARNRVVLRSPWQVATWEWDGVSWHSHVTLPAPAGAAPMVFDAARGRVLLFGGPFSSPFGQTWEWDGQHWSQRFPQHQPWVRAAHGLAYDPERQRVVLFGGTLPVLPDWFDTWEWDGTDWTERVPAHHPAGRYGHQLAFDPVSRRVVLFGGASGAAFFGDTWGWDGRDWVQLAATGPSPRAGHRMAVDNTRRRVVLFGGFDNATLPPETWEWDGSRWSRPTLQHTPGARTQHAMCTARDGDRGVLLLGGSQLLADLWSWDGSDWSLRDPNTAPTSLADYASAYDERRQRLVVFGRTGLLYGQPVQSETWEWDGSRWTQGALHPAPAVRQGAAMAYDAVRQRVVLFGGFDISGVNLRFDDTWEWDGTTWSARNPAVRPRARGAAGLVFDRRRGRLVLFGGNAWDGLNAVPLGDTWFWDGSGWIPAEPAVSPPPRAGHAQSYDATRDRVVVFGGRSGLTDLADTWEFDGQTWAPIQVSGPSARISAAVTFDAARSRTVLQGGVTDSGATYHGDTWEWDGLSWVRRAADAWPGARASHSLAYDPVRARVVLVGRINPFLTSDVWEYGPVNPARLALFGVGCRGTAGTPELSTTGERPWIGDGFRLTIEAIPAGMPALLLLASSRTTWGGYALPLDLTAAGMPGCSLFVSVDALLPVQLGGGGGTVRVGVPLDASLVGSEFFAQACALDPRANLAGVTVTNALAGRIGAR